MKNLKQKEVNNRIKFFTDRVNFYQSYFGLISYAIDVLPQIKDDACASIYFQDGKIGRSNRRVTIAYSLNFITRVETSLEEIDKSAFHEVCELLLSKLRCMAECGSGLIYVDEEIHIIVRVLENTLWKKFNILRGNLKL